MKTQTHGAAVVGHAGARWCGFCGMPVVGGFDALAEHVARICPVAKATSERQFRTSNGGHVTIRFNRQSRPVAWRVDHDSPWQTRDLNFVARLLAQGEYKEEVQS